MWKKRKKILVTKLFSNNVGIYIHFPQILNILNILINIYTYNFVIEIMVYNIAGVNAQKYK